MINAANNLYKISNQLEAIHLLLNQLRENQYLGISFY